MSSCARVAPPRLSTDELTRELTKLNTEVIPSFWKDPQPADVQGLYSVAVEFVFGKEQKNIRVEEEHGGDLSSGLPSLRGMDVLPHEGALHIRAIGNLRFLRYCQRLCRNVLVGMQDFSRADIFKPTPERLHRFANAFVQFLRFKENVEVNLEDHSRLLREAEEERQQVEQQLRAAEASLADLNGLLEQKETGRRQAMNLQEQLNGEVFEAKANFDRLKKTSDQMRAQADSLDKEKKDLDFVLMRRRQEVQQLQDRVVTSPEMIHRMMGELKEKRREGEENSQAAAERRRVFTERLETAQRAMGRATKYVDGMSSCLSDVVRPHGVLRGESKGMEREVVKLRSELEKKEARSREKQQAIQEMQEKISGMKAMWSEEEKKAVELLEDTQTKVAATRREISEKESQLERIERETANVEETIKQDRRAFAEVSADVGRKEEELRRWVDECTNKWGEVLLEADSLRLSRIPDD
eukprot:GHVS01098176.1.p1 GENE.GHVS01098176.1~~GHVS01098176.1.p1  ORF type:complete len:469 (+),score=113.99 GHVS01098176.1:226-1632(+)